MAWSVTKMSRYDTLTQRCAAREIRAASTHASLEISVSCIIVIVHLHYSGAKAEESDDECRPTKPVPQWAKSKNLSRQLHAQSSADPDEIFSLNGKISTCSLDDVFKTGNPKPCYKRRGSSGNWTNDHLTWKEEWLYKQAMGFDTSGMGEKTNHIAL